jgi:hypothetical protein
MLKPLRVSRMHWRFDFLRNRGLPTLRPLRWPDIESNQFR